SSPRSWEGRAAASPTWRRPAGRTPRSWAKRSTARRRRCGRFWAGRVFDLPQELDAIRAELTRDGIEYAICGGIAMAVHGFTRATEDIDLLVRPEDLPGVKAAVARLGFRFEANPMSFSK